MGSTLTPPPVSPGMPGPTPPTVSSMGPPGHICGTAGGPEAPTGEGGYGNLDVSRALFFHAANIFFEGGAIPLTVPGVSLAARGDGGGGRLGPPISGGGVGCCCIIACCICAGPRGRGPSGLNP